MVNWQAVLFGRLDPHREQNKAYPLVRLAGLFALAFLFLVIMFALAYGNTASLMQHNARVKETYQVLTELDQLRLNIKDVESRTRAYLLLGHSADVARIRHIRQEVLNRLDIIKQRARFQALKWAALEQEVNQQLDFAESLIHLRQKKDFSYEAKDLENPEGRFLRLEHLILAQRQVLANQLEAEHNSQANVLPGIVFTGVVALGILAVTAWLMLRDLVARLQAESQLREAYAQAADLAEFSHALNQQSDLAGCLQTLITTYAPLFHQTPYAIISNKLHYGY